jgi:endonuclease/exonuclease/phosphatase family metal-dependent hydrolase
LKAGYFPRTAGDVIVTTAGGTDVRVLDVHLYGTGVGSGGTPGSSEAQERQLVPLAETLDAWDGATLVAGDFNVNRGSAAYEFERTVLGYRGLMDSFTQVGLEDDTRAVDSFNSNSPSRNIDRVYVSGELRATASRVLSDATASRGSDHLPVVTDLVVQ